MLTIFIDIAGPLYVVDRNAYMVLFVIDPRVSSLDENDNNSLFYDSYIIIIIHVLTF